MAEKEDEGKIIPLSDHAQTIEKIVTCPNCGGKVKVEFEIELEALIPSGKLSDIILPEMPKEKEDGKN